MLSFGSGTTEITALWKYKLCIIKQNMNGNNNTKTKQQKNK